MCQHVLERRRRTEAQAAGNDALLSDRPSHARKVVDQRLDDVRFGLARRGATRMAARVVKYGAVPPTQAAGQSPEISSTSAETMSEN
jgi:hypothetical protein